MKKKKAVQEKEKKTKEKRKTITAVVLKCLDKNPEATVIEISEKIVAGGFPKSKFDKSHLSWYKYQVRKGKLHLPSGRELPPKKKKEIKKSKSKSKDKNKNKQ